MSSQKCQPSKGWSLSKVDWQKRIHLTYKIAKRGVAGAIRYRNNLELEIAIGTLDSLDFSKLWNHLYDFSRF